MSSMSLHRGAAKLSRAAVWESTALYPLTESFLLGAAIMILIADHRMNSVTGVLMFGVGSVLILLRSVQRELHEVHVQHSTLVERIDQLVAALNAAGIAVPVDPNVQEVAPHDSW